MMRILETTIRLGCWMTAAALALSVTILPTATADNVDDVVENLSKARDVGEQFTPTCDTTTANLDKRGALVYDSETGSLKFDVNADKGN